MQQLLIYFFIALGLSMDAFSLAIAYGTNKISLKKELLLSIFVGIFHYIMPLLGTIIGEKLNFIINGSNIIVGLIFLILAAEMYTSIDEEKKGMITNFLSILFFSLTVSIDSFSVGIALGITKNYTSVAFIIFSIVSATFTLLGLLLGKYLSQKLEKKSHLFWNYHFSLTSLKIHFFRLIYVYLLNNSLKSLTK